MNKVLKINWTLAEQEYAAFCLDLFDEKPIEWSRLGISQEQIDIYFKAKEIVLLLLKKALVAVLRFIFVKPVAITKPVEKIKTGLKTANFYFGTAKKIFMDYLTVALNNVISFMRSFEIDRVISNFGFT